ncbi:MAG TPA: Xaa-Pro aminopeptidase [Lachnospiraceae bacterium]|nr:Xaa-Pro aminopeptidase [Lachnospiraceae bacterium]
MVEFFKKNRNKLFDILEDGDLAVMFAGEAPTKRGDEKYLFSPDRNFYYMTGIERERCAFIMSKIDGKRFETLYIEADNGQMAKWVGANISRSEALEVSGIKDIRLVDSIFDDIDSQKSGMKRLFLDGERKDLLENHMPEGFRKKYKELVFEDLFPIISELRVIKEKEEIELMRKAIHITRLGIEAMMKNAKAGMMEYEIEAHYDYVLTQNGVRDKAFHTIAASGKNGTVLHYIKNNAKTNDGDLILIDAGAQVDYYNGDLSRTFPVNGKFSDRQKLVYNIVLGGQKLIMDSIKPNVPMPQLNEILKEYYYKELLKIGLVSTRDEVFKYYFHNVGHFLGAETHDVGERNQQLRKGMVITVEPGLYIEEWGIGIRIEDDVLVTEHGCENLSAEMIKTVDEIEAFMAKGI